MSPPGDDDDASPETDRSPGADDGGPSNGSPNDETHDDGTPTADSGIPSDDGAPDDETHDDGTPDDATTDEGGSPDDDRWQQITTPDGPGGADSAGGSTAPQTEADGSGSSEIPTAGPTTDDRAPNPDRRRDESGWWTFAYDIVSSALAVLLVGAMLFAVSGVWPPMVAVESPSMTPHMQTGDLVFVMEAERFPGEGATGDTGVVTARTGETTAVDYPKFQQQGDVIVYEPRGDEATTPIIHRAMFWVEENENWYDKADKQSLGRYDECGETVDDALPNCPAPHAGFITKGDANGRYDQVDQLSGPVKSEWVVGTAEVRVPKLGCVRLRTEGCVGNLLVTPNVTPAANATRASP